jgi:bifunctional DNA-binding transcriptional regulator/antitoxin component of YhaV-PrlF toxin-antitoxin module
VVIPAWVRKQPGLRTGEQLEVEVGPAGERTVLLRAASPRDFEKLLQRGYEWIARRGIDMVEALQMARRQARLRERKKRRP